MNQDQAWLGTFSFFLQSTNFQPKAEFTSNKSLEWIWIIGVGSVIKCFVIIGLILSVSDYSCELNEYHSIDFLR